jgi:hypothetical protein
VKQITVTGNGSYELIPDFSEEYLDYVSSLHPGELVNVEGGSFHAGRPLGRKIHCRKNNP